MALKNVIAVFGYKPIRGMLLEQALNKADHKYEPGAYGVCRRCGREKH